MRLFLSVYAAFFYDLMILAALSLVLSAFFTLTLRADFNQTPLLQHLFQVSWLGMVLAYFGLSYAYGGQTIGMRAWRLVVLNDHQQTPDKRQIMLRLMVSILNIPLLGLGWLGYLTRQQQSLTDVLSRTSIQRIDKKA
jgi:uncharacterized RDD family membrane protein YckC